MSLRGQQLNILFEDVAAWLRARVSAGYDHRELVIEVDDVCNGASATVRRYHLDAADLSEIRFGLQQADFADTQARLAEFQRHHQQPVLMEDMQEIMRSPPREVAIA